ALRVSCDPEIEQLGLLGRWIVHDVGWLEITMNNPCLVGDGQGGAYLLDDRGHQGGRQAAGPGDEAGKRLALSPLEREIVEPVSLTVVVRAHHVRVAEPLAELGLAQEALDGNGIFSQAGDQNLDRGGAALRMLPSIHACSAALADILDEAVTRHRATDEVLRGHP